MKKNLYSLTLSDEVVREVDVASKTMKITPMEGLFDL